jgi:cobalt/nickel transport system permease protein
MHLGNEAITPECAAVAFGAAGVGLGIAALAARRDISSNKLALAGALGALVFAAQAVNVPILPGSSAHLVGGVLLAWALGPGLGAWVMTFVLAIQALALGDGGIMALGANVLNMALLPAGLVAIGRRGEAAAGRWSIVRPALLAALSVPLAATLIAGQTALFRTSGELAGWSGFAVRMVGTHLLVGLAEGGLTALLLVALAGWNDVRRDTAGGLRLAKLTRPVAVSLSLAALLGLASLWSSSLPDGYEASAQGADMGWLLGEAAESGK